MNITYAQRAYDRMEPTEVAPTLSDLGTCPYCRKPLAWDGVDDTLAWCETPRCQYDNGIDEEENRERWRSENE